LQGAGASSNLSLRSQNISGLLTCLILALVALVLHPHLVNLTEITISASLQAVYVRLRTNMPSLSTPAHNSPITLPVLRQ
jgi:hypothetical protein